MTNEEFLFYCYATATGSTHCNMVSVTLIRLAELAGDDEAVALLKKQSIHTVTGCHEQVLAWVKQARARKPQRSGHGEKSPSHMPPAYFGNYIFDSKAKADG